jgi:hypothetical protein
MSRRGSRYVVVGAITVAVVGAGAYFLAGQRSRPITVDYPQDGSVFPPEFPPPTLLWRDASPRASAWTIDVSFATAPRSLRPVAGEPIEIGEIDPRRWDRRTSRHG